MTFLLACRFFDILSVFMSADEKSVQSYEQINFDFPRTTVVG